MPLPLTANRIEALIVTERRRVPRLGGLSQLFLTAAARVVVRGLFWLVVLGVRRERCGPFDLIDITGDPEFEPDKNKIVEASALIQTYDPVRYNGILKDLSLIVLADYRRPYEAQYHRFARAIIVRAEALKVLDVHSVAAMLVHEAVHGRLDRMGVRQTRTRMPRIERLCLLSEVRFLNRVPGAELLAQVKRERLLED